MRSHARWLLVLALALVLFAGCLGADEEGSGETASEDETQEVDTATASLWLEGPMYLTGSMGLSSTLGDETQWVAAGSFYTAWAQAEEQPTWEGRALQTGLHVSSVELSFYYTSESATVTTGPEDQGFPEFVVYFGTEKAPMAWASVDGPDVVTDSQIVHAEAELSLPEGGIVLPAGVKPVVKLAPVQGQGSQENTRLVFLVNSTATPSSATIDAQEISVDEGEDQRVIDTTGTLAGSAYALGAEETTTADVHELEVTSEHVGLLAELQRLEGAGIADIDLELLDPDGQVVARSVTPEADEGLALYQPNVDAIGEGTWTLRVVNYGNAAVTYELTADVLEASAPEGGT